MGSSLKELRGNADGVSHEEPDNNEVSIQYENIILLLYYIKILIYKEKIIQSEALGTFQRFFVVSLE